MIQHHEGNFTGDRGLELYYQAWYPQVKPLATLTLLHGLGSHSSTFDRAIQYLVPLGYAIYGFDLRGHGKSPGPRGHIDAWGEFREDLRKFLQLVRAQEPLLPHFLWGHSLGAAIALDYALHYPDGLQGVIATALPLGKVGVPPIKIAIGQILSQVWPHFTLNTGIDSAATSRDPGVVEAIAQDRLRHQQGSARLATEYLAMAEWLQTHACCLQVPLLLLHGGADRISPPEASRVFFRQVVCADKVRHEYEGAYHDLHDDLNAQEELSDLEDWLRRHLERSPGSCEFASSAMMDVCSKIDSLGNSRG
jgi:alpha-beta hydrolase superfamily lysophospholipase